jgi:hypothetical protein
MVEKEKVLEIGVEGGGATIFRTPLRTGGWQFHVEGTSMFLDENDDEDWRSWTSEPVNTIQEAMQSVARDGSWVLFHPISVHPEYRNTVWELVQETEGKLPEERRRKCKNRSENWQHLCFEKP